MGGNDAIKIQVRGQQFFPRKWHLQKLRKRRLKKSWEEVQRESTLSILW